jgi:tRNA-(ms[2]io[6]A)-hydroxylase
MLNLQSTSSSRWLEQVDRHLDLILIDHAHCEKKAAGTAMNLLFAYVENEELCRAMVAIVNEELSHLELVLDLLRRRGIRFRRLAPSSYGEPHKAVDRLLIAGLIEARSCERFDLLRQHVQDVELAAFYDGLFESEARHHSTYVRLAKMYADAAAVETRLRELAAEESRIIDAGDDFARMHS